MCATEKDTLNALIVQVCRAHRSRAHALFSAFGLHVGQEMILFALADQDAQTLSELAEKLELKPPTVTRMARRMGKNGLLKRRSCSEDGRAFRIFLTDEGRAVKEKLDRAWQQLETETAQTLTPKQQASLHTLLSQVHTNLSAAKKPSRE